MKAAAMMCLVVLAGCAAGGRAVSPGMSQASETPWSYTGERGPARWADLDPAWAIARTGREQSPVDIADPQTAALQTIDFEYGERGIRLVNTGHAIEARCDDGSSMRLDGIRYLLKSVRFHAPSEHTINGAHSAMEMQLVHEDQLGHVAVIAVLIDEGSEHAAFKPMWALLPPETGQEVNMGEVRVNVQLLLPRSRRYYRYRGSLTTPPCTEGVAWLVMQDPIRLSKDQVDRYRSIYSGNNRPVQQLYDRRVLAGQ